jgi:hypothetical protein
MRLCDKKARRSGWGKNQPFPQYVTRKIALGFHLSASAMRFCTCSATLLAISRQAVTPSLTVNFYSGLGYDYLLHWVWPLISDFHKRAEQ